MIENAAPKPFKPARRRFDMREFSRIASWGIAALGALTLAAYAASSEVGEDRLILAVASIRGVPPPERLARSPADETARQLTAAVRELASEREQLQARLDTLERSIGDITSSITRTPAAAAPPAVSAPPAPAAPPPVIAAPEVTSSLPTPMPMMPDILTRAAPSAPLAAAPAAPAASEEPAAAPPGKTEFGVDLGRAPSVDGLRQIWTTVKGRHGPALEGLRPVVAVREIARAGGVELRLVAGPLASAAAAARVCAMLSGAACHPTVFDGQRLALR